MAPPTKTPNVTSNISPSTSNSTKKVILNNNSTENISNTTTTTTMRKTDTGTKPKISPSNSNASNNVRDSSFENIPPPPLQSGQQVTMSSYISPVNSFSSINQQQQQQQQNQQLQQRQQLRKNTEIVAPIRRDLNDLNNYLLTTVGTDAINCHNSGNNSNGQRKQQQEKLKLQTRHNFKNQQNSVQHLKQLEQINQTASPQNFTEYNNNRSATSITESISNNDIENQRFCFPVRPIPRTNQQQIQLLQNNPNATTINLGSNLNSNLSNHPATIGVVIPTTPNLASVVQPVESALNFVPPQQQQQQQQHQHQQQQQQLQQQQNQLHLQLALLKLQQYLEEPLAAAIGNHHTNQQINLLDIASNILQTNNSADVNETAAYNTTFSANALLQSTPIFKQISKLTEKKNSNKHNNLTEEVATSSSSIGKHNKIALQTNKQNRKQIMVNSNSMEREVIVNSNSLENVDLSEMSDNRAQSIQSLHSSVETPTPDTTPSFEELQRRLEASNRNIQNMQEQQQQLLRIQNAAKQHLSDMEELRQHADALSFDTRNQNGTTSTGKNVPQYESIGQVQSDMATLVGRMKNLTTFIQNQNELGNLLGEDGPDLLAEQQNLQRKLELLRQQRDDMRSIVDELTECNRDAENTKKKAKKPESNNEPKNKTSANELSNSERIVPVEYTRVVPIEMLQTMKSNRENNNSRRRELEIESIQEREKILKKEEEIRAMKAQLKHLKDMMETVILIDEHTIGDSKTIEQTTPRAAHEQILHDRDRTPTAESFNSQSSTDENDAFIARKMQMINNVTSDIKVQTDNLQAERDRINALKQEIILRKQQAAAAAQLGEEALKRLTPTPTPFSLQKQESNVHNAVDNDELKTEYEAKKKQFLLLCEQLKPNDEKEQSTSNLPSSNRQNVIGSEADDEAEEDVNDLDFNATSNKFYSADQRNEAEQSVSTATTSNNNQSSFISTNNTTNTIMNNSIQDGASIEAVSIQSGSSQSFSIPPGMPTIGINGWTAPIPPPLPTSWNSPYYYGVGLVPPSIPSASFTPPQINAVHTVTQPLLTAAPTSSNECICHATASTMTLGGPGTTTGSSSVSAAVPQPPDPILMQQFIQTQQMLINSVCQCNQMLWHQQREIDALNNSIHILQERLLTLSGPSTADLAFAMRSESVPPTAGSIGRATNTIFPGVNRAQSEQPGVGNFLLQGSVSSTQRGIHTNYQQQQQLLQTQQMQQQLFQQRQRGLITSNASIYNYTNETQQNSTNANTNIFSTLNNAVPQQQQQQQQQQSQFNNETPQSPLTNTPGPIFMHHHNNSIHQNNANLRTQNHYANNQQQQQQHNNTTNIGGSNTLNNQVPPGNRANNYWDNFRSYSRQNLLSTNSNKSNEEQQIQQHDDQQYRRHRSSSLTNLQQQQHHHLTPHQQTLQQRQQLFTTPTDNNINNTCNNLNYDNNCNNKCFQRSLQRSRINQLQQQQYQQNTNTDTHHDNVLNTNLNNPFTSNIPTEYQNNHQRWPVSNEDNAIPYDARHYNVFDSGISRILPLSTSSTSSNIRNMNMNVNVDNSPHFQRNKVPAKQTYRAKPVVTTINVPYTPHSQRQQQQQQTEHPQQQQHGYQHFQQRFGTEILPNRNQELDTTNDTQNLRNHDFILSTFADSNADFDCAPVEIQTTNAAASLAAIENYGHFEDNEDTTSEEIKRNLLVNALKSDKFTTKFYESIKEDVFRRLESMLLDKENTEQLQPLNRSKTIIWHPISNDVSSDIQNQRDPMHKFYLNTHACKQQQQQQQQQLQLQEEISHSIHQQSKTPQRESADDDRLELDMEIDEQDENNAETESNNADNDNTNLLENAENMENEKPEENPVNIERININNQIKDVESIVQPNRLQMPNVNKNTNRKRKNYRKTDDKVKAIGSTGTENTSETQQQQTNENETFFSLVQNQQHNSHHDLINYVIASIRNQTNQNTTINDNLLVEISKLTANATQNLKTNDHFNLSASNISPKKMYTKIKKLTIPRQRDGFLIWYKSYLETLFQIEVSKKQEKLERENESKDVKNQQSSKKSLVADIDLTNEMKTNGDCFIESQNLDVYDADLAEADQTCSANTSGNTDNFLQINQSIIDLKSIIDDHTSNGQPTLNKEIENVAHELQLTAAATNATKTEVEEFENNENPDEEGGACGLQTLKENSDMKKKRQKRDLKQQQEQKKQEEQQLSVDSELSPDVLKRNGVA